MKKERIRILIACFCVLALLAGCTAPASPTDSTAAAEPAGSTPGSPESSTESKPESNSEDSGFLCLENPDGTLTLTGYTGTEPILDIPAQLNGKAVSAIGESCFAGMICLKAVHIPEGVTQVGDYAFESCTALHRVV